MLQPKEGEKITTKTGNDTTPFPKIDNSSGVKSYHSRQRYNKWIFENAMLECNKRKNKQVLEKLSHMDVKHLSDADVEFLEVFVFHVYV